MLSRLSQLLVICFAVLVTNVCAAQQVAKSLDIPRISQAPTIDGVIQPNEWAVAKYFDDLAQSRPLEYSAASQRTTWYLAYDSNYLYVAVFAYDTAPEQRVANVLRQGRNIASDDSVYILVDGFNNKRSGFAFGMNSNSVRFDAIYTNGTRLSDDWDGIWHGQATTTEDGWMVEMRIPFNTVTFNPEQTTWGVNFWRNLPRGNEQVAWQSRGGNVNPTVAGEMRGLEQLDQGLGLDVIPSFGHVSTFANDPYGHDNELIPSLDLSYKLTPSINGLLTLKTDFSAAEVDDNVLAVQRFGVFLPEKRAFFLTDFDIFQFGGIVNQRFSQLRGTSSRANAMPFYSRRIGLNPASQPVDVIGGAKVSGRVGNVDFGTLVIQQDEHAFESDGSVIKVDKNDLMIARATTGVLQESALGFIHTEGDPNSNAASSTTGIDFVYRNTRLPRRKTLEGQFWLQKSRNEDIDGDDMAFNAALGISADRGLNIGAQFHQVEQNFAPKLGFVNRRNVRLMSFEARNFWFLDDNPVFQRGDQWLVVERWSYLDTDQLQRQRIEFTPLSLRTHAGDFGRIYVVDQREGLRSGEQPLGALGIQLEPGEYRFTRYGTYLNMADFRWLSVELRLLTGEFYTGTRDDVELDVRWTPNKYFFSRLAYNLRYYDVNGVSAAARQVTWRNEVAFNAEWSLVALAQYDNISDRVAINTRLRYNPRAGQDLWLVLNHNMQHLPDENRFETVQTQAVVKLTYTFRF